MVIQCTIPWHFLCNDFCYRYYVHRAMWWLNCATRGEIPKKCQLSLEPVLFHMIEFSNFGLINLNYYRYNFVKYRINGIQILWNYNWLQNKLNVILIRNSPLFQNFWCFYLKVTKLSIVYLVLIDFLVFLLNKELWHIFNLKLFYLKLKEYNLQEIQNRQCK